MINDENMNEYKEQLVAEEMLDKCINEVLRICSKRVQHKK